MTARAYNYHGTCDCCLREDRALWLAPANGMAAFLCRECADLLEAYRFDPLLLARSIRDRMDWMRPAHGPRRAPLSKLTRPKYPTRPPKEAA